MKGHELEAAMWRKTERDVRRATMTWEQRKKTIDGERQARIVLQVFFTIAGLVFGLGSLIDILMLLGFGILGPLALRYDLL